MHNIEPGTELHFVPTMTNYPSYTGLGITGIVKNHPHPGKPKRKNDSFA